MAANADLADDADEIVIIYADNLSDIDLRPLLAFHRQHGDPLTMVLFRAPNPRACGIAELDGEGRIVSFVEKPQAADERPGQRRSLRRHAAAYREIAAMRAFDLGFDVLPRFVGRMRGWVWEGYLPGHRHPRGTRACSPRGGLDFPGSDRDRRWLCTGRRSSSIAMAP